MRFYSRLLSIIAFVRLHWICVPELIATLPGENPKLNQQQLAQLLSLTNRKKTSTEVPHLRE